MAEIPPHVSERERRLLSQALRANAAAEPPRKRRAKLRKVSEFVKRTWVSAGCFGEAVQWQLKANAKQRDDT